MLVRCARRARNAAVWAGWASWCATAGELRRHRRVLAKMLVRISMARLHAAFCAWCHKVADSAAVHTATCQLAASRRLRLLQSVLLWWRQHAGARQGHGQRLAAALKRRAAAVVCLFYALWQKNARQRKRMQALEAKSARRGSQRQRLAAARILAGWRASGVARCSLRRLLTRAALRRMHRRLSRMLLAWCLAAALLAARRCTLEASDVSCRAQGEASMLISDTLEMTMIVDELQKAEVQGEQARMRRAELHISRDKERESALLAMQQEMGALLAKEAEMEAKLRAERAAERERAAAREQDREAQQERDREEAERRTREEERSRQHLRAAADAAAASARRVERQRAHLLAVLVRRLWRDRLAAALGMWRCCADWQRRARGLLLGNACKTRRVRLSSALARLRMHADQRAAHAQEVENDQRQRAMEAGSMARRQALAAACVARLCACRAQALLTASFVPWAHAAFVGRAEKERCRGQEEAGRVLEVEKAAAGRRKRWLGVLAVLLRTARSARWEALQESVDGWGGKVREQRRLRVLGCRARASCAKRRLAQALERWLLGRRRRRHVARILRRARSCSAAAALDAWLVACVAQRRAARRVEGMRRRRARAVLSRGLVGWLDAVDSALLLRQQEEEERRRGQARRAAEEQAAHRASEAHQQAAALAAELERLRHLDALTYCQREERWRAALVRGMHWRRRSRLARCSLCHWHAHACGHGLRCLRAQAVAGLAERARMRLAASVLARWRRLSYQCARVLRAGQRIATRWARLHMSSAMAEWRGGATALIDRARADGRACKARHRRQAACTARVLWGWWREAVTGMAQRARLEGQEAAAAAADQTRRAQDDLARALLLAQHRQHEQQREGKELWLRRQQDCGVKAAQGRRSGGLMRAALSAWAWQAAARRRIRAAATHLLGRSSTGLLLSAVFVWRENSWAAHRGARVLGAVRSQRRRALLRSCWLWWRDLCAVLRLREEERSLHCQGLEELARQEQSLRDEDQRQRQRVERERQVERGRQLDLVIRCTQDVEAAGREVEELAGGVARLAPALAVRLACLPAASMLAASSCAPSPPTASRTLFPSFFVLPPLLSPCLHAHHLPADPALLSLKQVALCEHCGSAAGCKGGCTA